MDRLLRIPEAMARLGVSRPYIYRLLAEGRLKSVSLASRCRRVRESDLEAFIAELRQERAAAAQGKGA